MPVPAAFALSFALASHGPHEPGFPLPPGPGRAVTERLRAGEGEWTFESVPGWAKFPLEKPLGPTHGGIALDREGRIYASTDGPLGILVFAADGSFVRSFGPPGIHSLLLREEAGETFLYGARPNDGEAVKLRLDGTRVWSLGPPSESMAYADPGSFHPTAVAVAPDGAIFVADGYGTSLVHKFDRERKWVRAFGGSGTEDGKFRTCHGLALDERGAKPLLLVCDRENRRLVQVDLEGAFVKTLASDLRRPCAVAFLGGFLAVAELEGRLTILDPEGKALARLGDNPDRGQWANYEVAPERWKDGLFTAPHGLAFDREGNLFVQDWNRMGRVSKLARVRATPK